MKNFVKSSKTSAPISHSGATSLPSIGDSFAYIETSTVNSGPDNVFCSLERTDNIPITNITLYYNRFSVLSNG